MKKYVVSLAKNPTVRSLVLGFVLKQGSALITSAYQKYKNSKQVEIQADSYDDFYQVLLNWAASTGVLDSLSTIRINAKNSVDKPNLSFPEGTYRTVVNGKRTILKITKEITEYDVREKLSITVLNGNRDDIINIIDEAKELYNQADVIQVHTFQDGYWSRIKNKAVRLESSYILKEGQKEHILNDIKWFYANRDWYAKRGIPYHRGYLFSGPPGTGKTTFINVIASKFNKPVYILNLSSMDSDKELVKCMSLIGDDALVAFEDIDCILTTNDREVVDPNKVKKGVTLAGILNCLDGILTPEGVVFILTTNFPERLDKALLRPGRIDIHETLGFLDKAEQYKLSKLFYDKEVGIDKPLSAATLQQIFIENFDNPEKAQEELEKRHG